MPELMAAEQGVVIRDLVTQDQYLNLVIPYGRPSLVQQGGQSTAPVLKSAMGNCASTGQCLAAIWLAG